MVDLAARDAEVISDQSFDNLVFPWRASCRTSSSYTLEVQKGWGDYVPDDDDDDDVSMAI